MALGDVSIFTGSGAPSNPGSTRFTVHSGVAAGINAGEFVLKGGLGNTAGKFVTRWTQGSALKPSVGTDFVAGLAMSTSTDTVSANGVVDVMLNTRGMTYLVSPNAPTSWDTQAEYNALVGARVKLNCSATGVQTLLATDSLFGGFVVEPLDIVTYPGKVRVSLADETSYLSDKHTIS